MNDIKVSVVMPVLNGMPYFKEALESVLGQTLKELEVLVVDSGSTDGTREYVQEILKTDGRVRLLGAEKKSMGYQYNLGIQNAKGRYIGFCESDDYLHFEMYEKMYHMAEQEQLEFVKSDFDMFIGENENRIYLNYSILLTVNKDAYDNIICPADYPELLYRDLNMWNGIYSKDFLLEHDITLNETKGAAFQDMGFVFKSLMKSKRIMYTHIPSYYYRRDNGTSSVYNYEKHIYFIIHEMRFIWEYMRENGIRAPFRSFVFNRCFFLFCAYYDSVQFHRRPDKKVQKDMQDFMDYVLTCYKEMESFEAQAADLERSISLRALQTNLEQFKRVRQREDARLRKQRRDFFEFIKTHSFIIFGAGERGTSLAGCCYRNHINNILCFCDNSREKAGKEIMGKPCFLPEELEAKLAENFKKAYFVVANHLHYKAIKGQLMRMGVEADKIIRCIEILPHGAFEWDVEDFDR